MHVRLVTFTGATDIDGGLAFLQERVVPLLEQQKGFRGVTASADRANRVFGVLTLWENEEDLHASESALSKAREEGLGVIGGQLTVEELEQMVDEVSEPPRAGCHVRIVRLKMDPARVEDNVSYFKSEVLPAIKATPGFRAVRNLINRKTGEGAVGIVFSDKASMDAAEPVAAERRATAASRGVEFTDLSSREVLYARIS